MESEEGFKIWSLHSVYHLIGAGPSSLLVLRTQSLCAGGIDTVCSRGCSRHMCMCALLDLLWIFTNLLTVLSIRQFEHRTRRPQTFNGGATDSVALQPTRMPNASRSGSQVASSVTASL